MATAHTADGSQAHGGKSRVRDPQHLGFREELHAIEAVIADNTLCASACALAWPGGKERFMGKNACIGFHAARVSDTLERS